MFIFLKDNIDFFVATCHRVACARVTSVCKFVRPRRTSSRVDGSSPHGKHQLESCSVVDIIVMEAVVVFQLRRLKDQMLLRDGDA